MERSEGLLQTLLRQTSPDLAAHVDSAWRTAVAEWLPYIKAKDSSNNLPHVTAVERQLDALLVEKCGDSLRARASLNPVEIYLLLTAALLHDLDRVTGAAEDSSRHGKASAELIRAHWPRLRIVDQQLADIIADICRVHDYRATEPELRAELDQLSPCQFVFPYGTIRTRSLAALFYVADRMDDGYTRVKPDFLSGNAPLDTVGVYRSAIHGVRVDHVNRMIVTCVADLSKFKGPFNRMDYCLGKSKYAGHDAVDQSWSKRQALLDLLRTLKASVDETRLHYNSGDGSGLLPDLCEALGIRPLASDTLDKALGSLEERHSELVDQKLKSLADKLEEHRVRPLWFASHDPKVFGPWELAVAAHECKVDRTAPVKPAEWSGGTVGLIIMSAVCGASHDLAAVRMELEEVGILLDAWLIEYNGRLFTPTGYQTWEPILSRRYLARTADTMGTLWERTAQLSMLDYELLARGMRDSDWGRVRTAVSRLAVLLAPPRVSGRAVLAADQQWRLWPEVIRSTSGVPDGTPIHPLGTVFRELVNATTSDSDHCDPTAAKAACEVDQKQVQPN